MVADARDYDAQDTAEAFDEDNLDDEDTGPNAHEFKTFEELPELMDDTRRAGDDGDGRAVDEAEFSEELIGDEDLEDDERTAAADGADVDDDDAAYDPDEIELEFTPDVERLRGAQGSAAHFETRRELSDADLEALGYRDSADKES